MTPDRTDLPTLLHRAVPPSHPPDLGAIRDRARVRRMRRRGLTCVTVTFAIIAAVVGVVVAQRSPGRESKVATVPDAADAPKEVLERLPLDAYSVASGPDGSLWALSRGLSSGPVEQFVHRLDPVSGKVLLTVPVRGPANRIAVGAGRVWVGGGGDGAEPDGRLSVLDPSDGTVVAEETFIGGGPNSFAISDDTAWITTGAAEGVLRMTVEPGGVVRQSVDLGTQTGDIVVLRTGQVWVYVGGERYVRLDPRSLAVVADVPWPGGSLGAASTGSQAWVIDESGYLIEIDLAKLEAGQEALVRRAPTSMRLAGVQVTNDYLWIFGDGVERWPLPLEIGARPKHTPGRSVYSHAVVGDNAWFVAGGGGGGLWRWRPGRG